MLSNLSIFYLQRTPFGTPARALIKTMTMSAGEFDFDTTFRQEPGDLGLPDIAYPSMSFLLWVVFLVLVPVLLTNLLVSFWLNSCLLTSLISRPCPTQLSVWSAGKLGRAWERGYLLTRSDENLDLWIWAILSQCGYFIFPQTGLAVGDVKEIQEEAELRRISLKVGRLDWMM